MGRVCLHALALDTDRHPFARQHGHLHPGIAENIENERQSGGGMYRGRVWFRSFRGKPKRVNEKLPVCVGKLTPCQMTALNIVRD